MTDGRALVFSNSQTLVIRDWHPTTSANRSHDHWRKIQKAHHVDRDMAWASAMQAGWTFVPGKVRLTIELVYSRKYRIDADNLVAKCKGLIDGLKTIQSKKGPYMAWTRSPGFFTDDSTEHLELVVTAVVEPGKKETRITLEGA